MPYPISYLKSKKSELPLLSSKAIASFAIEEMSNYDTRVMPVHNEDFTLGGVITYESILRASATFGIPVENLRISNAMIKVKTFREDENLFDLLDTIMQDEVIAIVNAEGEYQYIITSYDAGMFIRQQAEDMMIIEDIESMLKEMITFPFMQADGEPDKDQLQAAVDKVLMRNIELLNPYQRALQNYLSLTKADNIKINQKFLKASFEKFQETDTPKTFDDLTLGQYINMFTSSERWGFYSSVINMDNSNVRKMLEHVRIIRNKLAHFQQDIFEADRKKLKMCADWLNDHYNKMQQIEPLQDTFREQSPQDLYNLIEERLASREEDLPATSSKYAPLAAWLQGQPGKVDRLSLTFEEIETIIGDDLPNSAYKHRAWWANDSVGHTHSKEWLNAGWRIGYRNMSGKKVTFVRIRERERAYIDFFGVVLNKLREETNLRIKDASPGGASWIEIIQVPETGNQKAVIGLSFTMYGQFRIELYIDTGEQEKNKAIFDDLFVDKAVIESELAEVLGWERIENKRASRVALYHPGIITDKKESLSYLQDWVIEMTPKFYEVIFDRASQAIERASEKMCK